MAKHTIIDTFSAFIEFWNNAQSQPLDTQIELWASRYMSRWPALLEKQQQDYSSQGVEWRAIARERVFPLIEERLPIMTEARNRLLPCIGPIHEKFQEALKLDFNILYVIYVGIGCGAGWATILEGQPACLFGLENIAECGYTTEEVLAGLTAHEIGRLLLSQRRQRRGLAAGEGPFWQLYDEGFAVRCEQIVLGDVSWHEQHGQEEWLDWCTANKAWLAAEFLRLVDEGQPVNSFFGSWFSIKSRSGCGHFLGCEVIRSLEQAVDFEEIALLPRDEIEWRARLAVERFACRVV